MTKLIENEEIKENIVIEIDKYIEKKFDNMIVEENDYMDIEENGKMMVEKDEETNYFQKMNERIKKEDISTTEKCINVFRKFCPKIFEIFEIKEKIGSGSESIVYKIIYKKTKKQYAMKLIFIENDSKRNYNEYNIINRFKNQKIIAFYGVYEIKKNEMDCMIMEYAKFGNLKDFKEKQLKRQELSEQLLCFLAYQILIGLKYIHKCKIIHFDLKPQNIIFDGYLYVKIIDFSVALDYSKIKSNKIKLPFRGTNFYIAPEVLKSKTINVNDLNKVDLYSLGVILYNLVFNTYPYRLERSDVGSYDLIYNKIENNKLEFSNKRNSYSKHFIDFLSQLLEIDINKRININQALNNYWINGAKILLEEKEKVLDNNKFLIGLLTDHFINFNKYINN